MSYDGLPRILLRLSTGKLFCIVCLKEMSPPRSRFHLLHCRERVQTGRVVDGVRQRHGDERVIER